MKQVRDHIAAHLDDDRRGERLRDGLMVVLLGAPNAGKSSLLNRLAERDVAIVTDIAGTTRDLIEVHLDLGGFPVTIVDTAGLRETADQVEQEGVRRALARARNADLKIVVLDGEDWERIKREGAKGLPTGIDPKDPDTLFLLNKIDRLANGVPGQFLGRDLHGISCISGAGMEDFVRLLGGEVARRLDVGEAPVLTRARHREALVKCRDALDRALAAREIELVAEDVRLAVRQIGRLTGRVDVEDLLDIIFQDFCIGK